MALGYSGIRYEVREVFLKDKPPAMLAASSKGTVPVLIVEDGQVIDESADIMRWALALNDPDGWWRDELAEDSENLLDENDFSFKPQLDRYKYWERYPQQTRLHYREQGQSFLRKLEALLSLNPFLLDDKLGFADVAIFPFVRQFAFADINWFEQAPYPKLKSWLKSLLSSPLFLSVMKKRPAWQEGDQPLFWPA